MRVIDILNKWLGRLPGRLGLLAVVFSTLFATMSGSSISTVGLMGSLLKPEMEARGYQKPISIGSIIGAGGLAAIIPPSNIAVLIGAIGEISIGRLLIAGIVPGLLIALLYATYIIGRCWLQPSIAPPYEVIIPPLSERLRVTVKYVLPFGLIAVLGKAYSENRLEESPKILSQPQLLIIDEIGYIPINRQGAFLF